MKHKSILLLLIPLLLTGCNKKKPITPSESEEPLSESISQESTNESISEEESESVSESISEKESESIEESQSEEESESTIEESESTPPTPHVFYDYGGYYDEDFSWSDSQDLMSKLHTLISSNVTSLKYEGNWDVNKRADQALYDHEMVNLLYSNENDLKNNTYASGKGWQREHAFAASLMTGFTSGDAVGVGKGRATDFHNLFAASYSGNTSRGNKNFGVANPEAEDGSYQVKDAYTFDSKNFEPSSDDKGLLSRAIMYMGVMYSTTEEATVKVTLNYNDADKQTYGKASTTVAIPVTYKPLNLVEDYVPYSKVTYTNWYYQNDVYGKDENFNDVLVVDVHALIEQYGEGAEGYARYSMDNCQFAIGNKSTLVSWAGSYDVSLNEMQHNNYVYSVQGNRNPFIDYPELVDYIYGDKTNEGGNLKDLTASYLSLNMNEEGVSHYAITSAKREFDVNETITGNDLTIREVKHDLSYGNEVELNDFEYTFTDEDAQNGTKLLEIETNLNTLQLLVRVNSGSLNSCSYQYEIIGSAASTPGSEFVGYTSGKEVSLGGEVWTFTWTNPNGAVGSKDKTYGLAFGKNASSRMNQLTIETKESHVFNAIYLKAATAANQTANYSIYVGTTLVDSGTFTRESSGPTLLGTTFSQLEGRIKIVINGSGATDGAIYIHTLAFNIVE